MPESEATDRPEHPIRNLTLNDTSRGVFLCSKIEPHPWNQTREDWERLIDIQPDGCFGIDVDGELVATATTTVYGDNQLAWIGMVITKKEHQSQGMGTQLLDKCIQYCSDIEVHTVKLDATPQGKDRVYVTRGFKDEYQIARRIRPAGEADRVSDLTRVIRDDQIDSIIEFDAPYFGANRGNLLRRLIESNELRGLVIEEKGHIKGYALAREGRKYTYLGPCVVEDQDLGHALLGNLLCLLPHDKPVFLDVMHDNAHANSVATALGFEEPIRVLDRMYLDLNTPGGKENPYPGQPIHIIGGSGFETG